MDDRLPRILIVDDEVGRTHGDGRINRDRARLCRILGLLDASGDGAVGGSQDVRAPVARAVFVRGQRPVRAHVGDRVENDSGGVLRAIREGWTQRRQGKAPWALILLDLSFRTGRVTDESHARQPGMPEGRDTDFNPDEYFGLLLLKAIRAEFPELPVAILSSQSRGQVDDAIDRLGHCGFVDKTGDDGREYLRRIIKRQGLLPDPSGRIVGHSTALLLALRGARRAASGNGHVLLRGERGTGKELFARYIHDHSERASRAFVAVDSGQLADSLVGMELFGHSDAKVLGGEGKPQRGKIAEADGGHLFLDEVGNLSERLQATLLRALDTGTVVPSGAVGESLNRDVDVVVLSATNSDLEGRALAGTFRADLLDRLKQGAALYLPPLSERRSDIALLVGSFFDQVREREKARADAEGAPFELERIADDALAFLQEQEWPGNVRQLASCIDMAVRSHGLKRSLHIADFEIRPLSRRDKEASSRRRDGVSAHLPSGESSDRPPVQPATPQSGSLDELLEEISQPLEAVSLQALHGAAGKARRAHARLMARLLSEALRATENVDGTSNYAGAINRLLGEQGKKTAFAADEIKRIRNIDPESIADLIIEDERLRDAFRWAQETRPSRKPKK